MYTQTVDTAKFTFGTNFLTSRNAAYFREHLSQRKTQDKKNYTVWVFKEKEHPTLFPGVNYLKVDNTVGTVTVVVSSKILGGDYWRKISLYTLPQVFHNLHATGLVTLTDIDELTQVVIMPASHPCTDMLGRYMPQAGHLLKLLHQRKDYRFTDYKDSSSNSVNFEKIRSTLKAKEFGRLYNKVLEFGLPENAAFRSKLTPEELATNLAYFSIRTRAEVVLGCSAKSREYYGVPDKEPLTAIRLLSAETNPVYRMFERFMKEVPTNFDPTQAPKHVGNNSLQFYFTTELSEKEKNDFQYLTIAGFDMEKIRYALHDQYVVKAKNRRPATVTERMKKLDLLNARWEAFKARVTQIDFQMIADMMEAMRNNSGNDPAGWDTQVAVAA